MTPILTSTPTVNHIFTTRAQTTRFFDTGNKHTANMLNVRWNQKLSKNWGKTKKWKPIGSEVSLNSPEVSPEKEKEGYGGKDLQKRKVLSMGWKSERVMDDTETMQHKHKYKQNTKYNDQVRHIIIFHQT